MHVVLVYLQPLRRNSLLKCASQQNAKNYLFHARNHVVNSELGKLPGLTCDALFHITIWCGRTMYTRLIRELK